jgi:hypothetical protein
MSSKPTKTASDKSAKTEKYNKEEQIEARVDAVLCQDPDKDNKKVMADVRITSTRPGSSSTTSVYLREAHAKWRSSHTSMFLQSPEGTELLVNNFDTERGRKAISNALLTPHGCHALRDFFLCTTDGYEVLMGALKSEEGRKLIRETLEEAMTKDEENKETQNTEDNPELAPANSDDSLEIVGVVPAPQDDDRKPAAKVKPKPATPSSKPPTPKSGNASGQNRKTRSSDTPEDDSNDDSAGNLSTATVDILVRDIVGQWKSRDALVEEKLKEAGVSIDGIHDEIALFLATLGEHRKVSRLFCPFDKTKPVLASNPTRKDLTLVAYVDDFKARMLKKYPAQSFLHDYLRDHVHVQTIGDYVPEYAAALDKVRIEVPRNNRS